MPTLRKQSEAAADLRDQLKRSLTVTGNDLANALSQIGRSVGVRAEYPCPSCGTIGGHFWNCPENRAGRTISPDKEDEYHVEEEAVDGTQNWDDGWFEEQGDE